MYRLFNLQHASIGAVVMGVYAALANLSAGLAAAGSAAAAQATLSFVIVGLNTALFLFVDKKLGSYLAIAASTFVALGLAAVVHAYAETVNYLLTLLVVMVAAIVNFAFLAFLQDRFGTINLKSLMQVSLTRIRS